MRARIPSRPRYRVRRLGRDTLHWTASTGCKPSAVSVRRRATQVVLLQPFPSQPIGHAASTKTAAASSWALSALAPARHTATSMRTAMLSSTKQNVHGPRRPCDTRVACLSQWSRGLQGLASRGGPSRALRPGLYTRKPSVLGGYGIQLAHLAVNRVSALRGRHSEPRICPDTLFGGFIGTLSRVIHPAGFVVRS